MAAIYVMHFNYKLYKTSIVCLFFQLNNVIHNCLYYQAHKTISRFTFSYNLK